MSGVEIERWKSQLLKGTAELAVLAGEYHATAAPGVLSRGLRHAFEHRSRRP